MTITIENGVIIEIDPYFPIEKKLEIVSALASILEVKDDSGRLKIKNRTQSPVVGSLVDYS